MMEISKVWALALLGTIERPASILWESCEFSSEERALVDFMGTRIGASGSGCYRYCIIYKIAALTRGSRDTRVAIS